MTEHRLAQHSQDPDSPATFVLCTCGESWTRHTAADAWDRFNAHQVEHLPTPSAEGTQP